MNEELRKSLEICVHIDMEEEVGKARKAALANNDAYSRQKYSSILDLERYIEEAKALIREIYGIT